MEKVFFIIIGFLSFMLIMRLLVELFRSERVFYQSFWWDTYDGLKFSSSELHKFKYFPIYFTLNKDEYRKCKSHPSYYKFLNKVKEIKQWKNY